MTKFKEALNTAIEKNPGVRFVFHPLSKEQTDELLETFKERDIVPIPPITLEQFRSFAEEEFGEDVAYEVNLSTYTTSSNNVEHWKQYTKDIIEYTEEDGIHFIKGCE